MDAWTSQLLSSVVDEHLRLLPRSTGKARNTSGRQGNPIHSACTSSSSSLCTSIAGNDSSVAHVRDERTRDNAGAGRHVSSHTRRTHPWKWDCLEEELPTATSLR
eukprot:5592337-Amphidinium_carterae.1